MVAFEAEESQRSGIELQIDEKFPNNRIKCSLWEMEYIIIGKLGSGSFGSVYRCYDERKKRTVAIKMLQSDCHESFRQEISIICKLKPFTRNFVQFLHSFSECSRLFIVMELLGDNLETYLQESKSPIPLAFIRQLVRQILSGLVILERLKVVHRDLKLNNIVFADSTSNPENIKIIDFGLAKINSTITPEFKVHIIRQRPPEVILGLLHSHSIDMWAVGCIAFQLYTNHYLFSSRDEKHLFAEISDKLECVPEWMADSSDVTSEYLKVNRHGDVRPTLDHAFKQYDHESFKKGSDKITHLLRKIRMPTALGEEEDFSRFGCLLGAILRVDPLLRPSPKKALKHKFFS